LNEGAPLTDQDFATALRYLARNFRPERYEPESTLNSQLSTLTETWSVDS
jgi:hypothetical protein